MEKRQGRERAKWAWEVLCQSERTSEADGGMSKDSLKGLSLVKFGKIGVARYKMI